MLLSSVSSTLAGPPEEPLHGFLGHWISLKKRDGTIEGLYDYWILGKTAGPVKPRWCILRDVLGWIDWVGLQIFVFKKLKWF